MKTYSITTLDGGQQVLMGQKESVIKAIGLAVEYANDYAKKSEHKKKEITVFVRECGRGETLSPENSIAEISVWFPTVARSSKSFWIISK